MSLKTTRTEIEPTIFVSLSLNEKEQQTHWKKNHGWLTSRKKNGKKKKEKKSTKRQREEAR